MTESAVAARPTGLRRLTARLRLWYFAPLLAILALGAWAFASPVGASPDDDFHLASIWCSDPLGAEYCEPGGESYERIFPEALNKATCYAQNPDASAACQQTDFSWDPEVTVESTRGSFSNDYPPVYYATMGLFAGGDLQASALLMRFLNILLFVGLTTALAFLLPRELRIPLVGGWILTTIPLGAFLLASNNPSAWAIIGVGSSGIALLGFFRVTGRARIALGVLYAVSVVIAAGSRADAAIYAVIGSAVAVWLSARRTRAFLISAALPVALSVVALAFFLAAGQAIVASSGLGSSPAPDDGATVNPGELSPFALFAYNLLMTPSLWAGVFGGWSLGWLDTPMPAIVAVGAGGVFAALVFAGLGRTDWRKTVAVFGVFAVLWLLPTYILVRGGNIVGQNVQPRYLLPLIVLLGMLLLLPVASGRVRITTLQASVIAGLLAVGNAFAMHVNIGRYTVGLDSPGIDLDAVVEWWWPVAPSPMAVWIVGSLAYAALLVLAVRELRKRDVVT